ncbi:hypothetical protein MCSF7_00461 [Mycoplasmopsis columbina SF7]|uniref:Transmembrane protein n=1 Tax=Mycoplasmopsis columbina SF7 TaxID=1037410 RepID=F9UJP5_9BACT|nr:hypothetical protein [Mycoplasmopsis columbina]EGV00426.1 hypothetical protein MCSF7_00461 [Mycoplasmopsis columbina SF7]
MKNQEFIQIDQMNDSFTNQGSDIGSLLKKKSVVASTIVWFSVSLLVAFLTAIIFAYSGLLNRIFSNTIATIFYPIILLIVIFVGPFIQAKFYSKMNLPGTVIINFITMLALGSMLGILFLVPEFRLKEWLILLLVPTALMIATGLLAAYNLIKIRLLWLVIITLTISIIIMLFIAIFAFNKAFYEVMYSIISIALSSAYMALDWYFINKLNNNYQLTFIDNASIRKEITLHGMFFGCRMATNFIIIALRIAILFLKR